MKFRGTTISKRTLALLAATALLVTGGTYTGTRAALEYYSEDYVADFELDHLQVHLIENGIDVCHGNNDDDTVHGTYTGKDKYHGNLFEETLGYENPEDGGTHYDVTAAYRIGTPGSVEPGKKYTEVIRVGNNRNIEEYVRVVIRKYWVDADGNKDTRLSPDLIKLKYGDEDYNSGAWQLNTKENAGSEETSTYYLSHTLGKVSDDADESGMVLSEPLFDTLYIDKSIVDDEHMDVGVTTNEEGSKIETIYTYTYDYDGYTFYVEADVQAVQTHNINDVIQSLWGVTNVTAANGKLTVN